MFLLSLGLSWLILILIALNFAGVNLYSGEDRFYMPPIALWLLLLILFIVLRQFNVYDHDTQQVVYDLTEGRDANKDIHSQVALQNVASVGQAFTRRMMHLLGIQSILAFALQLWGYKQTGQRYYLVALRTFLALSILYAIAAVISM
jgi:hypothetical protein